jgi:murein L,D-transpeptidase YafK
MKNCVSFLFFVLLLNFTAMGQDNAFLESQLSYDRVSGAYTEKLQTIKERFERKGLVFPNPQIFWRAFKYNKSLELWAYSEDSMHYVLVHTYPICEIVGDLGPKREEGDFQIPEGFYTISNFNPSSKYYLSLKINYPNESDQILGSQDRLGGEIYIHGKCETIGCLPMTDDLIKEIYIINVLAKNIGVLDIPIHIFPAKLSLKNMNKMKQEYFKDNTTIIKFWNNMKLGFDWFETKKMLPIISVDPLSGKYIFN